MAEVLCIPKAIPEHTGYQIRGIRVCAYCRVSTDDDSQYHSYDAQTEYYKGLIQKNPDWEFCGIYADEGISGTSRWGREDFQRMMEECEKGRIDLILTKSITRFARNTVDTLSTVRHLKELGVSVYSEKENINTLDDSTEMILTILSSQAQEESRPSAPTSSGAMQGSSRKGNPQDRGAMDSGRHQMGRCASWRRKPRSSAAWPDGSWTGTAWKESGTGCRTQE